MTTLHIADRRERQLVRAADALLSPLRLIRRRRALAARPQSVLCFRLERIGDLLMTLPALAALRAELPDAAIDLVVGSWNADLARAIPGLHRVEVLDAAWLARGSGGLSVTSLMARTRAWRARRYDLAINFEPDIRSNLAAAAAGARVLAGFTTGGGAALLDIGIPHDPRTHTADNALALVRAVVGGTESGNSHLTIDAAAQERARERLGQRQRPLVGVHVSGGRAIKQWPEARFAEVARWLVDDRGATIVLTGTPADRAQIAQVRQSLPEGSAIDVSDLPLADAAAVLQQLDVFVTGDTGPMHLAHAVGTPVVAVFGPSDPARYAPRGPLDRVVRVDLPCSPCNRIRQPPARCVGHTPDCLAGVTVAAVTEAIDEILSRRRTIPLGVASIA